MGFLRDVMVPWSKEPKEGLGAIIIRALVPPNTAKEIINSADEAKQSIKVFTDSFDVMKDQD